LGNPGINETIVWFDGSIRRRKPALAEIEFNPDSGIQPVMPIDAGRFIR
jgi:hypothetical protein